MLRSPPSSTLSRRCNGSSTVCCYPKSSSRNAILNYYTACVWEKFITKKQASSNFSLFKNRGFQLSFAGSLKKIHRGIPNNFFRILFFPIQNARFQINPYFYLTNIPNFCMKKFPRWNISMLGLNESWQRQLSRSVKISDAHFFVINLFYQTHRDQTLTFVYIAATHS